MSRKFLISLSALAASSAFAALPTASTERLVIRVKPGFNEGLIATALRAKIVTRIPSMRLIVLNRKSASLVAANQLAQSARRVSGVADAFPDPIDYPTAMPNDPRARDMYSLRITNVPLAFDLSMGRPEVEVAVIDSGLDATHPDIAPKLVSSYDVADNDADVTEDAGAIAIGHGTHVAGTSAAATNNGIGVASVGGNVSLNFYKAWSRGENGASRTVIIAAIDRAIADGSKVVNLSLGSRSGDVGGLYAGAVARAAANKVILVAAAGNDGVSIDTNQFSPAGVPGFFTVGATDDQDRRAIWFPGFSEGSNFGRRVDIAAPGKGILSTYPLALDDRSGYHVTSGTSMAAPFITGTIGLMYSFGAPDLAPETVIQALQLTAVKQPENWLNESSGRVDVFAALQLVNPGAVGISAPNNAWVSTGSGATGDAASLADIDSNFLMARGVPTNIGTVTVSMAEFSPLKVGMNLVAPKLRVTASATSTAVTQQIFFRDWTSSTAKYDLFRAMPLTTSGTVTMDLRSLAPKYLDANGKMQVMVRALRPRGRGTGLSYHYRLDQLTLSAIYRPIRR